MKTDSEVALPALRRRLTEVRKAQQNGSGVTRSAPPVTTSLLVSPAWLDDALETRALELENLIVVCVGVQAVAWCSVCGVVVKAGSGLCTGCHGEARKA